MLHEYEIQKRKMDLWRWKTNVKNRIIFESENEFKNWIRDGLKSGFKISILNIILLLKVTNFKPFESQLKDWESQSNGFYPPEQDPL